MIEDDAVGMHFPEPSMLEVVVRDDAPFDIDAMQFAQIARNGFSESDSRAGIRFMDAEHPKIIRFRCLGTHTTPVDHELTAPAAKDESVDTRINEAVATVAIAVNPETGRVDMLNVKTTDGPLTLMDMTGGKEFLWHLHRFARVVAKKEGVQVHVVTMKVVDVLTIYGSESS